MSRPDWTLDKNGRPLVGATLAARARARMVTDAQLVELLAPRTTVTTSAEASVELTVELPFARHRGGAEAPPWRR